jgi:hypothetical protein
MAIKANLTIDQGADFTATVDVKQADGQAFNLTNHTARGQMRKNFSTSAVTAAFICTVPNPTLGQITLKLPNANVVDGDTVTQVGTNSIEPGRYLYDIEIEDSSSPAVVTRVVQGTVTVTGGITR